MTKVSQPTIAAVLALHNEAKNIAACLDAVKDWVDEIVIVDGESTDETVAIVNQYTKNIITTTNKPNFHINKQQAIDAATSDLIVQLDADEIVDPELKKAILALRDKLDQTETNGWQIARKNFFFGHFLTKGGQYPDYVVRVFRKGKGKLPQKDVHEQIAIDGTIETLDGHLLHYSNPDFGIYLRKWNTYTSLEATHAIKAGFEPNLMTAIQYCMVKPLQTFTSLYFRHKGFMDGWAGFIFAKMSALFHIVVYIKAWEKHGNRSLV